jgi:hypothetical protein
MSAKSDYLEQLILELIFKATTNELFASAAGSQTHLYIALHTANPYAANEAATQTQSETTYTGYARVAVPRSGSGWVRTNSTINPAAVIDFPECTGGTATITHFSIGTQASGAGNILYAGAISPNIAISMGVIPRLTTGSSISED